MIDVSFEIDRRKKTYGNEFKEYKYLKLTDETKKNFVKEMERTLTIAAELNVDIDVHKLEDLMIQSSKKEMEVTVRKRLRKNAEDETEPIWFNKEIKKEISKRRNINKMRRKASTDQERAIYDEQFLDQKIKVQRLVREAINKHEKKITDEILKDPNRSKNLWKHINKLKGKDLGKPKK